MAARKSDDEVLEAEIEKRMSKCLASMTSAQREDMSESVQYLINKLSSVLNTSSCHRIEVFEDILSSLKELESEVAASKEGYQHPCNWGRQIYCPKKIPLSNLRNKERFMPAYFYYND